MKNKRYTGALCGLGYETKKEGVRPIFTENDIEHVFDCLITNENFKDVS